jgi:hypothetical protein
MPGVRSTSIAAERGDAGALPTTASVARAGSVFARAFAKAIGAPLEVD